MTHLPCILGIDVGTTSVKAMIFDRHGAVLRTGQQEYSTYHPSRAWAEQEPDDWWETLKSILKPVLSSSGGGNLEIMAVGVSSQAPAFVPVDVDGSPVNRALIWMDRRADEEAKSLYAILGQDRVIAYSRNRADSFYTAAKVLWFKRHMPEKFSRIHKVLQVNGYINYRLTGVHSMDDVHASITQLYDVRTRTWAYDVLEKLQIASSLLPDIYPSGAVIGAVTAEAAAQTGLQPGTPVIAGTVDGAAAAVEAGVIRPGVATEMTGTSSVLITSNDLGWYSPELITMNHALPDQTLCLAAISSTGASLKWYRDEFFASESGDVYEIMNRQAEQTSPYSEHIFLPYMAGERSPIWDTDARGMFFGLSLSTSRADLIRAIMEGSAYALKNNLDIMENSGNRIEVLRIIGGSAGSRLWNQIKADVLNREIEIIEASGGAPLGAAILAGIATGFYRDPESVLEHVIRLKRKVSPKADMHAFYSRKYPIFLELYRQTREQYRKLAAACSGPA